MRPGNKSPRMGGLIEDIQSWVKITPTEKATTAAQDKVLSFAEQWGLTKFLPEQTKTQAAAAPSIMQGIDPKLLYLTAGALGLLILLPALKRRRR